MERNCHIRPLSLGTLFLISQSVATIAAQAYPDSEPVAEASATGIMGYVALVAVVVSLSVSYFFWRKSSKGDGQPPAGNNNRYKDYYSNSGNNEQSGPEAEMEMEWLRKGKISKDKIPKSTLGPKRPRSKETARPTNGNNMGLPGEDGIDTRGFQEKMRKLQYSNLPINSFTELTPAKLYTPLPVSDDQSVLAAIEQANDEFEEDETVRDLAVRVLTRFRTRNSVEALSQIALYDLSSNLRSKAVSTLTDFDHESVFEIILLACADPTREVRAAAARGLFRLSFDRADSWKRIIETNDEFRMTHAARAAIESGFVVKSFDRLVHEDLKVAYEAFAMVTLLVRSGETNEIFDAIKTHKDERVRFALIHCLKILRDERAVKELAEIKRTGDFSMDVSGRIADAINHCEAIVV